MSTTAQMTGAAVGNRDDAEYARFRAALRARFAAQATQPLYTTDAPLQWRLWNLYLASVPPDPRDTSGVPGQYHNCSACRDFINRYGGLVTIDEEGFATPVLWDAETAIGVEAGAVYAMQAAVASARVTGVFYTADALLGHDEPRSPWVHMAVTSQRRCLSGTIAGQQRAEKREDYGTLARALAEFSEPALEQAVRILEADALYRSEKVLGMAQWLLALQRARLRVHGHGDGTRARNLLWRAVATAPPGFCHPRASMIGTLLDDLIAGLPFEAVAARFKAKMHPLQYQRPQAAPKDGTITRANALFAELGLAPALRRRYCRPDEVDTLWRPTPPPEAERVDAGGVFDHLREPNRRQAPPIHTLPAKAITWVRFAAEVLPEAREIAVNVGAREQFCTLTTAAEAEAPPVLQWDLPERRNPVAWYYWHGGAPAQQYGLTVGWVRAWGVAYLPPFWYGVTRFSHHAQQVLFLLDGARETRNTGLALFPECLRTELREVRAVIEAHSRTGTIEEAEAHAVGLPVGREEGRALHVRATLPAGPAEYRIDRWD